MKLAVPATSIGLSLLDRWAELQRKLLLLTQQHLIIVFLFCPWYGHTYHPSLEELESRATRGIHAIIDAFPAMDMHANHAVS